MRQATIIILVSVNCNVDGFNSVAMDETAVPPTGKLTVILDGSSAVEFFEVTEDYAHDLAVKFQKRNGRPFWLTHKDQRLMLFPRNPPKGILWEARP